MEAARQPECVHSTLVILRLVWCELHTVAGAHSMRLFLHLTVSLGCRQVIAGSSPCLGGGWHGGRGGRVLNATTSLSNKGGDRAPLPAA